jgi:hypothetical protein
MKNQDKGQDINKNGVETQHGKRTIKKGVANFGKWQILFKKFTI